MKPAVLVLVLVLVVVVLPLSVPVSLNSSNKSPMGFRSKLHSTERRPRCAIPNSMCSTPSKEECEHNACRPGNKLSHPNKPYVLDALYLVRRNCSKLKEEQREIKKKQKQRETSFQYKEKTHHTMRLASFPQCDLRTRSIHNNFFLPIRPDK